MVNTLNLSLKTIIRECSKHPESKEAVFQRFSLENRENVHEIFRYKKFLYDFTDYVSCYNDGNYVLGKIHPCYEEFFRFIGVFLGVEPPFEDNEEFTKRCDERIERLKSITSEIELKTEFPHLYHDLMLGRSYIKNIKDKRRMFPVNQELYEEDEHYYYSCAMKYGLKNFIASQAELYSRFVHKRDEYRKLIESKSYNRFFRENFDVSKVALLAVYEYCRICESTEDINTLKKYSNLIDKYFHSNFDKNVRITLDNKTVIDYTQIVYYSLRIKGKIKRIENQKEIRLGIKLVPEGSEPKIVKLDSTKEPRPEIYSQEEYARLREKGRRKQEFYQNSSYLRVAYGLEQYDGYMGYIYPNGEVLLDYKYNEFAPRTAANNAIYRMNIGDLETLGGLDKTTLRNHPKVTRIIHSKNWEEKAKTFIKRKSTEEERRKTLEIIERLEQKSKEKE